LVRIIHSGDADRLVEESYEARLPPQRERPSIRVVADHIGEQCQARHHLRKAPAGPAQDRDLPGVGQKGIVRTSATEFG